MYLAMVRAIIHNALAERTAFFSLGIVSSCARYQPAIYHQIHIKMSARARTNFSHKSQAACAAHRVPEMHIHHPQPGMIGKCGSARVIYSALFAAIIICARASDARTGAVNPRGAFLLRPRASKTLRIISGAGKKNIISSWN